MRDAIIEVLTTLAADADISLIDLLRICLAVAWDFDKVAIEIDECD